MRFFQFLSLSVLLAGCTTIQPDKGFSEVATQSGLPVVWRHGGAEDAAVDRQVQALLAQPLTQDAAVKVTLLNNRGLQAEYEELGIAQADLVQAGLLRNPAFGWSRMEGGGITKTNWGLEFDFLGLLLLAPHKKLESLRFEHAKLRVTQAVAAKAAETRKAWAEALAAEQSTRFLQQVKEVVETETELFRRQHQAGNVNARDLKRQQAFAVETGLELSFAQDAALAARERLHRLMGLGQDMPVWSLPERLPEVPAALPDFSGLQQHGLARRLDLQLLQKEAEALAAALKITRDSRLINVFDLGVETEKSTGEKRITGPTLKIELPIFDQGQARVSAQEARYRQSEARLAEATVNAWSEIREAQHRTEHAYARVKLAKEQLVPLRSQIVEESTLHYNGMLIGVYDVLADARAQVSAVQAEIAALRDFWMAMADLQMAVGGGLELPPAPEPTDEKKSNHGEHGEKHE